MQTLEIQFETADGQTLDSQLALAPGVTRAYAIFAHCFEAGRDDFAAKQISLALAQTGISVLHVAFLDLDETGASRLHRGLEPVSVLEAAALFLSTHYEAPQLLVGHSLAGTAGLIAAQRLPSVHAIATVAAPADHIHVEQVLDRLLTHQYSNTSDATPSEDQRSGVPQRPMLTAEAISSEAIQHLRQSVLLLHSPADTVVDVHQAGALFAQLKHPKSFISLNQADHFLTHQADARYVAQVIAAWAGRYLPEAHQKHCAESDGHAVTVWETGQGLFQNGVCADGHPLSADEPVAMGGDDTGPSPFTLLAAGLGACTNMTLRMYANHKGLPLSRVQTTVHSVHTKEGHRLTRAIELTGDLEKTVRERLLAIANKCPVHKMLETGAQIESHLQDQHD
ncbi:MAG: osmotically inducible protein C [Gammaproteobacteria bacterium]|nr:osmotically inducible protein C [Gammaproteobacteria bacterium]